MKPRPCWRWWLFCAALWCHFHTKLGSWPNHVVGEVLSWSTLPEWFGWEPGDPGPDGEVPF